MNLGRIATCGCALGMGVAFACSSNDEMATVPDVDAGVVPDASVKDSPVLDVIPNCQNTCSEDGTKVLLCDGGVAETCSGDQTCVEGKCMTACEAADATHANVGCDYYIVPPDPFFIVANACFASFVVNPGTKPATLTLDRKGGDFDTTKFAYTISGSGQSITYQPLAGGVLPPGQSAILFLSAGAPDETFVPCPTGTNVATSEDPAVHGSGYGDAFHLRTSEPVVAYDISPYGGGASLVASATLLLPTSTWDTNYIGVDAYAAMSETTGNGVPWMTLVAQEDDTEVRLTPTSDLVISGPGLTPVSKGKLGVFKLDKGQMLQFEQNDELVGTPILANKPIGLWGGHTAMVIPDGASYADGAHQQIPPIRALGSEYVAVSHRDRFDTKPESHPWRIVGTVDGTTLTYLPAAPKDAPTTLNSGQMIEISSTAPFVVKSQDDKHPFYMAGYMSSCGVYATDLGDGIYDDCRGDPEFVNAVPAKQFLDKYEFLTDPTYPETNLVVIRAKGEAGFADVTLDCFGPLTGWTAVGDYEWTRVDLVRHNFVPQGSCNNGVHTITSTAPFGLTVWGWGSKETEPSTESVSYAYPAGMYVKSITDVVVTPVPK